MFLWHGQPIPLWLKQPSLLSSQIVTSAANILVHCCMHQSIALISTHHIAGVTLLAIAQMNAQSKLHSCSSNTVHCTLNSRCIAFETENNQWCSTSTCQHHDHTPQTIKQIWFNNHEWRAMRAFKAVIVWGCDTEYSHTGNMLHIYAYGIPISLQL